MPWSMLYGVGEPPTRMTRGGRSAASRLRPSSCASHTTTSSAPAAKQPSSTASRSARMCSRAAAAAGPSRFVSRSDTTPVTPSRSMAMNSFTGPPGTWRRAASDAWHERLGRAGLAHPAREGGDQTRRAGRGRVELEGAHKAVHAGAVVERLGAEDARRQFDELGRERDGVADRDTLERSLPARGADVEELLVEGRRLVALVGGDDVRGLLAADRVHRAARAVDHEMAAGDEQGRHAADLLDGDVAVVVDVGDNQADLIGVRGHDDLRAAGRADVEPDVAQRIGLDLSLIHIS